MIVADSSYPLGGALVTMTVFFGWFLWIWLLITVYMDLFRRDDVGGWAKAGWVIFTLLVPFLGVFAYLIVHGKSMADRREHQARRQQQSFDDHVRRVAGSSRDDGGAEVAKARQLLEAGAVTPDEYEVMRKKALLR